VPNRRHSTHASDYHPTCHHVAYPILVLGRCANSNSLDSAFMRVWATEQFFCLTYWAVDLNTAMTPHALPHVV
jgi:hypothetical protein